MKCPLKTVKTQTALDTTSDKTLVKIEVDFGECDLRMCMGYNASKGICRMMERNIKNDES